RAANQRFRGELTGIEGPDQQLKQTRMGHQEFEEQTAQTVGFDESKKIIQRCIWIGRLRQALEQERTQIAKNLAGARRDVKTAAALPEISERVSRAFLIGKDRQVNRSGFGRCLRNNTAENRADPLHGCLQRFGELLTRPKPEAEGESSQRLCLSRHGVGLLLGLHLQAVLDTAQKEIGLIQRQNFFSRKKIELAQRTQSLPRACLLEKRVTRAVDELERLDNKFDFANATCAELDVPFQVLLSNHVAFDPAFDAGDFVQQIGRRTSWVNEGLELTKKFVAELTAAAHRARFDQGQALPCLAKARVVIFHADQRTGERTGGSFRPETKIDPIERAFTINAGKRLSDFFAETIEPFVSGNTCQDLALLAVHENKIDIGAVIQFATTEFPQAEHNEFGLGRTVALAKVRIPMFVNFGQTDFGELRQFTGCFFQRSDLGQFAQGDSRHLAALPATKSPEVSGAD